MAIRSPYAGCERVLQSKLTAHVATTSDMEGDFVAAAASTETPVHLLEAAGGWALI